MFPALVLIYLALLPCCLHSNWSQNKSIETFLTTLSITTIIVWGLMLICCAAEIFFADRPAVSIGAKVLFYIVVSLQAVFSILDVTAIIYFGHRVTDEMLFVILQTNGREMTEFVSHYLDYRILYVVGLIGWPFITKFFLQPTDLLPFFRRVFLVFSIVAALCAILPVFLPKPIVHSSPLRILDAFFRYLDDVREYEKVAGNLKSFDLEKQIEPEAYRNKIHVVIIGESISSLHMSLYGYHRKTNPKLESLGSDLLVFKDVISPHVHTDLVLQKALSSYNAESGKKWYNHPVLMDIYRAAGYQTTWISNQESHGVWGNLATTLANRSDVVLFSDFRKSDNEADSKDEGLLAYLDEALKQSGQYNLFIVMHLMGAHWRYAKRFPADYRIFSTPSVQWELSSPADKKIQRITNDYDNALLYNDNIVYQIIQRVQAQGADSFVLYFSDHGEDIFRTLDFCGHEEKICSGPMVMVPMLLWTSVTYKNNRPALFADTQPKTTRPYVLDDLFHTVIDLSGIRYAYLDPQRSIINPHFNPNRTRLACNQAFPRSDTFFGIDYFNTDRNRIWAHRVNDPFKLAWTQTVAAGVELDLVFRQTPQGAIFDVVHPPNPSRNFSLDQYFEQSNTAKSLGYWLDIKNLSTNNNHAVTTHLNALLQKHQIDKRRLIVESPNHQALTVLSDSGLYTSYYLPEPKIPQNGNRLFSPTVEQLIAKAKACRAKAISYPGYLHPYIKQSQAAKNLDLDILTWFPQRDIRFSNDALFIQDLLTDAAVRIVLVSTAGFLHTQQRSSIHSQR